MIFASVAVADLAQADGASLILQLAITVGRTGQAVQRVIGDVELHHALAKLGETLVLGMHHHVFVGRRRAGGGRAAPALRSRRGKDGRSRRVRESPSRTGVGSWCPWTWRRPSRTCPSARAPVRRRSSGSPFPSEGRIGVPVVEFLDEGHDRELLLGRCLFSGDGAEGTGTKSSGKCFIALLTGIGVRPPIAHSDPSVIVTQRSSTRSRFFLHIGAGDDLFHRLDDRGRRRSGTGVHLPQLSDGAEFESELRLVGHIDRVVEHDNTAVPHEAALGRKSFVVERRIEQGRAGNRRRAGRRPSPHGPAAR